MKISSLTETTDGGFLYTTNEVLGSSGLAGAKVKKIDQTGGTEWDLRLGMGHLENQVAFTTNIDESEDGGAIIAGSKGRTPQLWKISANGELEWIKDDPSVNGRVKTVNGGYLIASRGAEQFNLLKTDGAGNTEWSKKVGSGSIQGLYENPHGYLFGATTGIYQTDISGNLLWAKSLGNVAVVESLANREVVAVADKNRLVKLSWNTPADPDNPGTDPNLPGDGLRFEDEEYSINVGDTFDTVVTVNGAEGTPVKVTKFSTYKSDNPDVLSIDAQGNITGLKRGVAVITAIYGGKTAAAMVNVY